MFYELKKKDLSTSQIVAYNGEIVKPAIKRRKKRKTKTTNQTNMQQN